MTDKYYTPELCEFFVGFTYEHRDGLGDWIPTVFTLEEYKEYLDWENDQMFTAHLEQGNMRVKYLDENGLIELGFTETEETNPFTGKSVFVKKEESGFNTGVIIKVALLQKGRILLKWQTYSSYENYSGDIQLRAKNKSNFKKLLEALNF